MYFQLAVIGPPDPTFSWILAKHPENRFERDLAQHKGMRVVSGGFGSDGRYAGEVVNDRIALLLALREHNAANYLDATLHAVCPANLKGFATIFRSVMYGKNACPGELSDEAFSEPKSFSLEIGPFPSGRERSKEVFAQAGLRAEVLEEGTRLSFTLRIDTTEPTSTTEFLQKAYLLSYYLTRRVGHERELNDDQIERMVHLCSGWLDRVSSRDQIVRGLCGFRRGAIDAFEEGIAAAVAAPEESDPDVVSGEGGSPLGRERDVEAHEEEIERKISLHEKRHALILSVLERDIASGPARANSVNDGRAGLGVDEQPAQAFDARSSRRRGGARAPQPQLGPRAEDVGSLAAFCRREGDLFSEEERAAVERLLGWLSGQKRPYRVIDLGSAEGKLSLQIALRLPGVEVLAVDADLGRVLRARQKMARSLSGREEGEQQVRVVHANLLYPELRDADLHPDALILSEVIEHLEQADRIRLLRLVVDVICPRVFVLTTPNVEYNPKFGMPEGTYRHDDHRVEYTQQQFRDEVTSLVSESYEVEVLDVVPGEDVQPSFVMKAVRKSSADPRTRGLSRVNRIYAPFHLDATNYEVTGRELRLGATTYPFLRNARDIFYLGPTISPADYDGRFPGYLEHPVACFDYYRRRGVTRLVGEEKYMGSRAYVLVLRDPEMAKVFGVSGPCVVNARTGLPFFGRSDGGQSISRIYADLRSKMRHDLVILDAEILPWSSKAGDLIDKEFVIPGETALLSRRRSGDAGLDNARIFLDVLSGFTASGPLEVRPFHVLATANLSSHGTAVRDLRLGFYTPHAEQLGLIEELCGDVVRPCAWHEVDLEDPISTQRSIDSWTEYTESRRGEGFVYKPAESMIARGPDGYYRQPAVKVRGRDYLRLIYGIDYLERGWFDLLRVRGTKRKRALAAQQQEMAERLLLAFLHRSDAARLTYVAAFLGVEDVNMREIDRTL